MSDFISQATLSSLQLNRDVLWHERLASLTLDKARNAYPLNSATYSMLVIVGAARAA